MSKTCRAHRENVYRDGTLHITSRDIQRGKVLKIYYLNDLFNLFPDHDFGENIREDEQMIPYNQVTNHFLGKLD